MKPNEQPKKTFFDMVIENSKLKEKKPTGPSSPNTPAPKSIVFWIGWLAGFFLLGLVIHLSVSVLTQKSILPVFSYIEILKLYAGALVLKRIFK
jgi:hypothetical protein